MRGAAANGGAAPKTHLSRRNPCFRAPLCRVFVRSKERKAHNWNARSKKSSDTESSLSLSPSLSITHTYRPWHGSAIVACHVFATIPHCRTIPLVLYQNVGSKGCLAMENSEQFLAINGKDVGVVVVGQGRLILVVVQRFISISIYSWVRSRTRIVSSGGYFLYANGHYHATTQWGNAHGPCREFGSLPSTERYRARVATRRHDDAPSHGRSIVGRRSRIAAMDEQSEYHDRLGRLAHRRCQGGRVQCKGQCLESHYARFGASHAVGSGTSQCFHAAIW